MNLRFDLFFGLALQNAREYLHLFPFRCFNARQTMIIQTGFTDGDDARILRQFAQGRYHIFFSLPGLSGVNPDHGVNVGILFRDLDRAAAARNGSSDRDDARYACVSRAAKNITEIWRKIRIIEVGVGFD